MHDNQQVFQQYLQEVRLWCEGILSIEWEDRDSTLFHTEHLLAKVEELQCYDYISEMDVLDVKRILDEISSTLGIQEDRTSSRRVPIGEHKLPPLPYRYNALEPYISREIMELHHTRHHKAYVDGLNKAEKEMQKARENNNFDLIKHWSREATFHGSGHYLHTMFWDNMSPKGGGQPSGTLAKQINLDFGSFDKFKLHFTEAADKVEGVGWALLVWSPRAHRLEILQTEKQQLFTQWDTIPLLGLDMWEHAYYLQYKADKKDYIENWWNIVNWKDVEKRFSEASKLKWQSF
ncbi:MULTISPECIES: superoxide dismutase [Bacillus]|uniref:superoxide dismutase n=1 Tax=Bacillus TaxID=1386 RepID=UPI00387323C5